jgi:hypothetical protein
MTSGPSRIILKNLLWLPSWHYFSLSPASGLPAGVPVPFLPMTVSADVVRS